MKLRKLAIVLALFVIVPAKAQDEDFDISESFLKQLHSWNSLLVTMKIKLEDRTKYVHKLPADCEIHIAGKSELNLGEQYPDIVVEPPNLCRFYPPGSDETASKEKLREEIWPKLLDVAVMKKDCEVRGFFRIFTEHKETGESDGANPGHVFEIHPALSIKSSNQSLSFENYLTVFQGMRKIKAQTAASCIQQRTLSVRYDDNEKTYQFYQEGGGCGNFAIVELMSIKKSWVRKMSGGHAATARVSADGQTISRLQIYTLDGSAVDAWLDSVMKGKGSSKRRMLHGLFTYDYFAIIKAVRSSGGTWSKSTSWKKVENPLAFVVFGETKTVPWESE